MKSRLAAYFLIFICTALYAADPTGRIAGTIVDPANAPVAQAKITATNTSTGFTRQTLSATDGGFVFPLIPVGTYEVVTESPGFRRFEQRGVLVAADANVTVSVALQVGNVSESVTVDAHAELVDTRSGTLGQVVTQQQITELPLNGRNAAALVLLAPGTADLATGNARGSGDVLHNAVYPGGQAISSNGSRSEGVNYFLDGASNLDPWTNSNNPFPNPDALEEFSVQTNNFGAEYGRAAGGVVNIVTKSGTNQFHGTAFEFLRNGAVNARNFFAPTTDKLKRNQYGGSFGGPVLKDKLFFFGTYQGTKLRNVTAANTAFLLTPAQRGGNFSTTGRQLIDPLTKTPFPGNIIPQSRIDPVSAKLLNLLPVSTSADGLVTFSRPQRDDENQYMGRIDYNFGKHRLYGRYFSSTLERATVSGAQSLLIASPGFTYSNKGVSLSHTFVAGPSFVNNAIFAWNRNDTKRLSGAPFGLDTLGVGIAQPERPEISLSVAGYFSVSTGRDGEFDRPSYNISDSAHVIKGVHELTFGGDLLKMSTDVNNTYRMSGDFRFRGTSYSGNALSDFLLGSVERFIQGGGDFRAQRVTQASLFVQDNMRISRKLNVNLGLRWDPWIPYKEGSGRIPCYAPGLQSTRFPNAPSGYLLSGDTGCPEGGARAKMNQFAPRLSFAYNFDGRGRTVLRGGTGIFYQPPFTEAFGTLMSSAPFSPQFIRNGVAFDNPWAGTTNPFPKSYGPTLPASNVAFDRPLTAVSLANDWRPSRTLSWNLTLERQLPGSVVVRAAYAASKGTFLGYNLELNPGLYSPGGANSDTQERRPNQNYSSIIEDVSGANSIYNSLQVSVEKRFSHGVNVSANYTYAKSIDEVSYLTDVCSVNVINPYNALAYRGPSDYNVPHRLVMTYLWQLPSPKENKVLKTLLGGWQTTGIVNLQSGFPLTINSGEDNSLTGIGNDNADVISKPSLTSGNIEQKINKWFTTEAFRTNAIGTFGNAGRNILYGPGTFNIDFSGQRLFTIRERYRLQFRGEFFNLLNHTLLNNPGTTVTSADFGRITDARDARIIQFALKFLF